MEGNSTANCEHGESMSSPIRIIPDDSRLLGVTRNDSNARAHLFPTEYESHLEGVLLSHDSILQRTRELAKQIKEDYSGQRPLLICLLKGAGPFYHDLLHALNKERQGYTCEFIRAKSYEGTGSTGNVKVSGMDLNNVKSKHIVIVEDIVDTGTTMAKLLSLISEAGCESVHVCTLLEKRIEGDLHQSRVKCKYSGFSIPNKFVIGYGLDFNESYRDLDDIWVMSSSGIQFGGKF